MKSSFFGRSRSFALTLGLSLGLTLTTIVSAGAPAVMAADTSDTTNTTSTTAIVQSGDYASDSDDKEHDAERKEVQSVINTIEGQWNGHDLKAYMANYADDYVNNDGLDKKAVQSLTEEFWKTYPDAHSGSKIKEIRVEGNYATVQSRDTGTATTEMQGMSGKGELQSVSEGQQYLKRFGSTWKIIGDRIDFEKVKVAFGLAQHLNSTFTAPEQVKAGKQFSARVEVALPPGCFASGSITNQVLKFPQPAPAEKPRQLDQPAILERVMPANTEGHNELLTATVIFGQSAPLTHGRLLHDQTAERGA